MISVRMILTFVTLWIFYGGMIALAIIYDGIYIQVIFDSSIMFISGFIGYYIKRKNSKEAT